MLPSTQIKRNITFHFFYSFFFFKGCNWAGSWSQQHEPISVWPWLLWNDIMWDHPKRLGTGRVLSAVRFVSEVCMPCACINRFLFRVGRPQCWRRDASGVEGVHTRFLSSRHPDALVPTVERGWRGNGLACLCTHPPTGHSRWSWSLSPCLPPVWRQQITQVSQFSVWA